MQMYRFKYLNAETLVSNHRKYSTCIIYFRECTICSILCYYANIREYESYCLINKNAPYLSD